MQKHRDPGTRRELAAAALLMLFGIAFSVYAAIFLTIGSFAFMGPGMFPLIVGVVISGLGLTHCVATLALDRRVCRAGRVDYIEEIRWRSLAVVIASLAMFSAVVELFGLLPGIVALTVVASLGSERLTPKTTATIAAALMLVAWTIFIYALGLPFKMYDWPF